MPKRALSSAVYEAADVFEVNELFFRNGWTDGLPVLPPTEERVAEVLDVLGLEPDAVIGIEPVRRRRLTAEKVAINAVMAGCRPEDVPVVIAALQAMCEPAFNLHGSSASTGGSAPLLIVNGPIRRALGMNATHNVFANGSRANATIGRAVRLVMINVLGSIPGQLDRSTLGHPGKFTFCIAEDEEDSPWLPLAQERGIPAGTSAVTVFACESPHQVMNEWTHDPRDLLETYVAAMCANMLTYSIWPGNYVLVIPKQQRDLFARAGWQKRHIREYLYERARLKRRAWRTVGKQTLVHAGNEDQEFTALRTPDDLLVVAAGGAGRRLWRPHSPVVRSKIAGRHPAHCSFPPKRRKPMSLRVLDPTSSDEMAQACLAPRLPRLEGATIGLLDNGKRNVARFLDHLEALLRARYLVRGVVRRRKPDFSRPAPPEVIADFRGCDALIAAVGD
ncbi:MAG: hypothetical protein KatS3mg131_2714 [Candidatus Tectimicrobiota bacterium]|nr:MAG: hypothetical protein KatS3mg131_2714 [Candidatus Tectomicrobia bacterium]